MDEKTFKIAKSKVNNTMISIEEARLILKDNQMTDEDVQETINSLQLLVELMYDNQLEEAKQLQKVIDDTGLDAEDALEIAQDL